MRYARIFPIIAAMLLAACGAPQQAAQPAVAPTPTLSSTSAALLDSPALNESQVPEPSPTATGEPAPNSVPATPELVLPPTDVPPPGAIPATPQPAASAPVRLVIKDIDMDWSLVSVGLDKNRVPIVPKHDVGWYNLSAMPGQGENIVLWGHVLRFKSEPKIPAPFARLKDVQIGARVVLYDGEGNAHSYVVTQQVWVTPDQVAYILPQGKERVTMVSCIGDKVIENGSVEMTNRLITIAEPAS